MYPSDVKINFAGRPELAEFRDVLGVFDNNMFATAWITICLLEAYHYAKAPRPTDDQLGLALKAIDEYHDKNTVYENSVMNFWPQKYNQSTGTWQSTPRNMLRAFGFFDVVPAKLVEDFLKMIGLGDVAKIFQSILSMRSTFQRAFHIPPDFDDTFVNMGLGSLLADLGDDMPDALALWREQNSNVTSALDALRQYAYRPFSSDQNVNTIDVRTYYYMRHFLNKARARGEDIALVPTWVQNLDEARKNYYKGVAMPFQMNNVDVTVAANTVYGLTASVLSGVLPASTLDDPLIRQVYVNTSSMIAHQVTNQLYGRPDLELTYYPSVFEFYWFVARTYSRMETALQTMPLPDAMQEVFPILKSALEKNMTKDIMEKAKAEGQDMLYFDDFLGDGDVDKHNQTLVRGEDRLFTTSVAINALLSTWTVFSDVNKTIYWKTNTPTDVRNTVDKSVRWLTSNILEDTYKPFNVFFSGSTKGKSGTIPEDQYKVLITEKHFGMTTPTNFTSFNEPGNYFPFWASPAYTYANAMLALARFDSIVG
nr:hypothetical protein BaRGS_035101 [Batillaria attramentaria]